MLNYLQQSVPTGKRDVTIVNVYNPVAAQSRRSLTLTLRFNDNNQRSSVAVCAIETAQRQALQAYIENPSRLIGHKGKLWSQGTGGMIPARFLAVSDETDPRATGLFRDRGWLGKTTLTGAVMLCKQMPK